MRPHCPDPAAAAAAFDAAAFAPAAAAPAPAAPAASAAAPGAAAAASAAVASVAQRLRGRDCADWKSAPVPAGEWPAPGKTRGKVNHNTAVIESLVLIGLWLDLWCNGVGKEGKLRHEPSGQGLKEGGQGEEETTWCSNIGTAGGYVLMHSSCGFEVR